jgi:hypothetical protein
MGGPPKPGPSSSLARKLRPDMSHGMVMGRIFSARKLQFFSTRPKPGATREMIRSRKEHRVSERMSWGLP